MRVCIITVCRNAAEEIAPTLRSVAAQTYPQLNQVIIDGASSDATLAVVGELALPGATVISEPDAGIYDAMNKGLGVAFGDLICFLNAGDTFVDQDVVADVVDFFKRDPSIDVAYGGLRVIAVDATSHEFMPPPADLALEELVRGCLPHQATFARPRAFPQGFDLAYSIHADYDWFVKTAFNEEIKLARIERIIATFQLGGTSSRLQDSQPQFYAIQNSAAGYQSNAWLRRRIEILQQGVLEHRLKNEALEAEIRSLRAKGESASAGGEVISGEEAPRSINTVWDRKLSRVRDRRN